MYNQNSILIAGGLLACMLLAIEIAFRVGRLRQRRESEGTKSQINSIQAAILGLLALLLGFTFSLALQRHDSRSVAVVEEANAIGTAYLRSHLLPAGMQAEVRNLFRDYLDARIQAGTINLADPAARDPLQIKADRISGQLWRYAVQAAEQDARSVASGLFIQSLNDVFDAHGKRDAALERHVPEAVIYLLFVTLLLAGSLLGYASGIAGQRTKFATITLVALIVVLVFIIIDLDRPRRGLIQVSQKSLVELRQAMAESPGARGQR